MKISFATFIEHFAPLTRIRRIIVYGINKKGKMWLWLRFAIGNKIIHE